MSDTDIDTPRTIGAAASDQASVPEAPRWRRWTSRTMDLTIVLIVLALFLAPVIIAQGYRHLSPSLLIASAWVYVAALVGLAISFAVKKRRPESRARYVTVGMSILDLRALQVDRTTRLVRSEYVPELSEVKRGRAAAAAALPLIVLGLVFLLFELVAYA